MKPISRRLRPLCLLLAALLTLVAGCNPLNAAWFGLGALFASQFQTTTVEYRCFQDGVEVDCSQLSNPPPTL
jgi:hypothetical protein